MIEPAAAPTEPVQRRDTLTWKDSTFTKGDDAPTVVEALKQAVRPWSMVGLFPPDLRHPQEGINGPLVQPTVENLFKDAKDYGAFNLARMTDVQRLIGLIVQTHRAGAISGAPQAGGRPAVVSVGRNKFQVVEKSKEELERTLALWNAYYQYKMAQYEAIRAVHPDYYGKLSSTPGFKNFQNVGTMIGVVADIATMTPREIHDRVRAAINPTAPDRIAAVLMYKDRPTETTSRPSYVDVL